MRFSAAVLFFVVAAAMLVSVRADWWDDFIDTVHAKVISGADFIKETAGPAIREKFDSVKETLQDPETHEKVQTWIKEDALPVVKEKFGQFQEFVNDDVVPELRKIYDAANEAHQNVYSTSSRTTDADD